MGGGGEREAGGGVAAERRASRANGPPGLLTLVSTPIGNLGDLSPRALDALRAADAVLCEDTRVTGTLLARHGVSVTLIPLHEHNEAAQVPKLLDRLAAGERLALASDAGTPLVSDPGYRLVRAAIAAGLPVTAVPGPNAAVMALTLSGLPPHPFLFHGFLPVKPGARAAELQRLRAAERAAPALAGIGRARARGEGGAQLLDAVDAGDVEHPPALALAGPAVAGGLPSEHDQRAARGAAHRMRVHDAPRPAVEQVQRAARADRGGQEGGAVGEAGILAGGGRGGHRRRDRPVGRGPGMARHVPGYRIFFVNCEAGIGGCRARPRTRRDAAGLPPEVARGAPAATVVRCRTGPAQGVSGTFRTPVAAPDGTAVAPGAAPMRQSPQDRAGWRCVFGKGIFS